MAETRKIKTKAQRMAQFRREATKRTQEYMAKQEEHDAVNKPSHYTQGKVECIDAIESATMGLVGIVAVCVANVIKYVCRHAHKNGREDILKAIHYLNLLIEYHYNESHDISESLQEGREGRALHADIGGAKAYPGGEVCNND